MVTLNQSRSRAAGKKLTDLAEKGVLSTEYANQERGQSRNIATACQSVVPSREVL